MRVFLGIMASVLILIGCQSTQPTPTPLSKSAVIEEFAQALDGLESYHYEGEFVVEAEGLEFTAEGDVKNVIRGEHEWADLLAASSVRLSPPAAEQHYSTSLEAVLVGNVFHARLAGDPPPEKAMRRSYVKALLTQLADAQWTRIISIDAVFMRSYFVDPSLFLLKDVGIGEAMMRQMDVVQMDEDEVDGIPCYRLTGFSPWGSVSLPPQSYEIVWPTMVGPRADFTVWVSKDHFRPIKLRLEKSSQADEAEGGVFDGPVEVTVRLSRFNQDATIEDPLGLPTITPEPFVYQSRPTPVLTQLPPTDTSSPTPQPSPTPPSVPPDPSSTGRTTRVSIASDGAPVDKYSIHASISGDGRYVAFESQATKLAPGNTKGLASVFLHDRQTGKTTWVSAPPDGSEETKFSARPCISADGRFVGFMSRSANLIDGETFEGAFQVYVHERETGDTKRVSVGPGGVPGNEDTFGCTLSADGRFVAFLSYASNLVPDDTNGKQDIFVHDRETGQTTRVSTASDGTEANQSSGAASISADGRYVAYMSGASNLVPNDTNNYPDVFVHDREKGKTTRVSVDSDGSEGRTGSYASWSSMSADGRYVAFRSSDELVVGDDNQKPDVFVHDRQTGQTSRIQRTPDLGGGDPSISADGRYVAFPSIFSGTVASPSEGVAQIYVHDRETGETMMASVSPDGTEGTWHSRLPFISADGRYVAFQSQANNLIPDDDNESTDIFVRDLQGQE